MDNQIHNFMKRITVKNTFLFLSLFSLIVLSSCEKDNPPSGGGGNDPKNPECNTYGTFVRLLCGSSIYDNYWIKTDDGRYLQPCATDVATFLPLTISEGTRVKFGYKKIYGRTACDDIINCAAIDERMSGSSKIRVTCIEIVNQEPDTFTCNLVGRVLVNDNCKLKMILGDDGTLIEPQNQDILIPYANRSHIQYSYSDVATLAVTCSGAKGVILKCIDSYR
jgi:hypothetical protein